MSFRLFYVYSLFRAVKDYTGWCIVHIHMLISIYFTLFFTEI